MKNSNTGMSVTNQCNSMPFGARKIGVGQNGRSSLKTSPRAKLPITDPPKVWVSGFLSADGNGKLVSEIMNNGKNGHSSPKMCPRAKLRITVPVF